MSGFRLLGGALDRATQARLLDAVLARVERAPLYRPIMPGGRAMSVQMTNFGRMGWISDRAGYRYQAQHPDTGAPWPPIPDELLVLWARHADADRPPDACLVNLYQGDARMGLHQDLDEADLTAPVLSVSLGDTAVFRLGGPSRRDPTRSLRLASGDVCLLEGQARLAFHGVDRVIAGSSTLIPVGGRINLTLRRAA